MRYKKYIKPLIFVTIAGFTMVFAVVYFIKSNTEKAIYKEEKQLPYSKVAIIFGAGINGNKPSSYLRDRLDAGINLYKKHKVEKILLSGDNGRDEYDELTVMKLYCYQHGVDTNNIYIDYAGFDSYSTMYRAKHLFKVDMAILVSQKYHLNRCVFLGEKMGIKSFGYSANKRVYTGYKYYSFRENLSIFKSAIDLIRNRKPKYLGDEINIDGPSNYTKVEK